MENIFLFFEREIREIILQFKIKGFFENSLSMKLSLRLVQRTIRIFRLIVARLRFVGKKNGGRTLEGVEQIRCSAILHDARIFCVLAFVFVFSF